MEQVKSQKSEVESEKPEMRPAVGHTWTRKVSIHGTVGFNNKLYRVPDDRMSEVAGQKIYVFVSPINGKVRGEKVSYDAIPEKDRVFELVRLADGKRETADNSHTNYIKEAVRSNGNGETADDILDSLGMDDMRLIALFEMWQGLETKFMQPFTDRFFDTLNEDEKKLLDSYCAAKIAVLGGNATLSINPKKKAGAEA